MRMYDILARKRDGGELSDAEIGWFIEEYTAGRIPDYQASALLMAIYLNGMTARETVTLTARMAASGDELDLSSLGDKTVDKHSTGGVGDKTTLIVAPLVAACGGVVAKMSGRGLGHTGGTVDKLESIEGFRTDLSVEEFLTQVQQIGLCVVGQTGHLAPADKKLYALRDVTATVGCIPLIASSVMGKKLAAGSRSIVLDVKVGAGAFMKTAEEAKALARAMVAIGEHCGRRVCALITDMDAPLGQAVGNALEVQEAIEVLQGRGPQDLTELCVALASHMLRLSLGRPFSDCESAVRAAITHKTGFQKLCDMVHAQDGRTDWLVHPDRFPTAPISVTVTATADGYVAAMDAEQVGLSAMTLGAGRETKESLIDPAAGIRLHVRPGDRIRVGDALATLYTADQDRISPAAARLLSAVTIAPQPPASRPLIHAVIDSASA